MRKLLLLFTSIIYLNACKDSKTDTAAGKGCDTDSLTTAEWAVYPEYNKDYVQAMVNYYFTLPKTNENIIRGLPYASPLLRKLTKNTETITAYVGAYLKDTLGVKAGTTNVIIQIKKHGKFHYYDYQTIFKKDMLKVDGYCPPPKDQPCPIEDPKTDSLQ